MTDPAKLLNDETILDTLRLSDPDWYAWVSELDRASSKSKIKDELRKDERVAYRNSPYIVAVIHNYDSRKQYFKVRTYDLSRTGLGFFHGGFIHLNTHIELWMQHCDMGAVQVHATVRNCMLAKGTIHHVGVEFDEPIEINDYLMAMAS